MRRAALALGLMMLGMALAEPSKVGEGRQGPQAVSRCRRKQRVRAAAAPHRRPPCVQAPDRCKRTGLPAGSQLSCTCSTQQARQAAVCAAPAHATPGRRSRHARGHAFTGISAAPQVAEGPKKNGAGLLFIT
jgi:hypothetical protein